MRGGWGVIKPRAAYLLGMEIYRLFFYKEKNIKLHLNHPSDTEDRKKEDIKHWNKKEKDIGSEMFE